MIEIIEISGGQPLQGSVRVSGAKNAALAMLIAPLLTCEECHFDNIPAIEDIIILTRLLEAFGADVQRSNGKLSVKVPSLVATEASYSLVKALRASFWVPAPLLARGRAARVALPGGDIIGARPVDIHLSGLSQMGADIKVKNGVVLATAVAGLKPANIEFRFPSVGATHQILMAAALTPGTTVLKGAACEPEVQALAELLNAMGGDIEGAGTPNIVIRGREELGGASASLIGDRIEAGTYLLCAAATNGHVRVEGFNPAHLGEFLGILGDMGLELSQGADFVEAKRNGGIQPVNISTGPFPLMATDLQAPIMAALCLARGTSTIEETIFEGRFGHVSELCRMGANITIDERTACIHGVEKFTGAPVEGFDIRAAVSLVLAGLAAEGVTKLHEPHHIRRGYDSLEAKLRNLGAKIGAKLSDPEDYMFTGC